MSPQKKTVLDFVKSITANRESGRLDINAAGTPGTLLFHEGKLVDARLGSLSGFQAVNAAAALRDAEVSFDHVAPASHISNITPSERLILSRFFGIEAADMEEPKEATEPEIDWNPAPEPVVPLAPARTIPFAFLSRVAVAACVALLLGVVVGAVMLRSKMKALQQSVAVANAVETESSPVAEPQPEVKESQPEVKQVAIEPAPVPASPKNETPVSKETAASKETPASSDSSAPASAVARREPADRDVNVQDLNGEWRVINTVENTAYKSFGNMQIGFRLTINQTGKEFTATGEKFSENGQTLPVARRTPIQVKGSIDGDNVTATFIEDGRSRRTNGRFDWKLQTGRDGLAGTFVSNAANSSGRSAVTRQ